MIVWGILAIPPRHAGINRFVVDVFTIHGDFNNAAAVAVSIVVNHRDRFAGDGTRQKRFGFGAKRLPLF